MAFLFRGSVMSKLAHSNDETMLRIDIKHAIEVGEEDLVGLETIIRRDGLMCSANIPGYPNRICLAKPKFRVIDKSGVYCERHAEDEIVGMGGVG